MSQDDTVYFEQRVRKEIELAKQATCPEAATAHSKLAWAYRARLTSGGGRG